MESTKITRALTKALETRDSRGWDHIYVLVDLHSTVVKSNWSDTELPDQYYDYALDTLYLMTLNEGIKLILWTSSWERDYIKYKQSMAGQGVIFDYVNENPEEVSNSDGYACFEKKMYFNLILDDKAGFEPEEDWEPLRDFMIALNP